jgi:hypothetical protein
MLRDTCSTFFASLSSILTLFSNLFLGFQKWFIYLTFSAEMYVSPTSILHAFVLNTTRNIKNSYPVSYFKRDVESTKEDNE